MSTGRSSVNISDDKKKIATADTLNIHQGSLTENPTAVIRYQYDNHLGSASLELDENADVISYEEYHPFGTTSYRSGRTETETSQKRYKYVGKERDEETGLYYYGFRYYAAWICRFVSVDPLQFEYPQLTPFNYAGNKPITHIDIDGLQSSGDEKRNSVSKQSFTINQNEKGEITSVSISNIDVIYGENGEIVSGIENSETHENIWTLKESELYNSLNGDLKEKLNNQLSELNPDLSEQESLPDDNNNTSISSNDIEGQMPQLLSTPQKPSGDKVADALTVIGIGSGIGEYSSKATWGKYKNSKGKVVKIESLKESKGLTYKKQGNVDEYGKTKKLSKHAKKAIKRAKLFKAAGKTLGLISMGYEAYNVIKNKGKGWQKAAANIGFTAIAMWGGPVGAAVSAVYFSVDMFYPGGWKGLWQNFADNIMTIHSLHSKDGVMMAPWHYGK